LRCRNAQEAIIEPASAKRMNWGFPVFTNTPESFTEADALLLTALATPL